MFWANASFLIVLIVNNSTLTLIILKRSIATIFTLIKKTKSVAYSSQGSHTSQLDFCNCLADGSTTG